MSEFLNSWAAPVAVGLCTFAVLIASRFLLGQARVEAWTKNLPTAQTAFAIVAIIIGGFWYFWERPRAARLNIDQTVTGLPGPNGTVLLVAEVSITNPSGAAIDLRRTRYKQFVQTVIPTPKDVVDAEFGHMEQGAYEIFPGDNWGVLARHEADLPSFLEAGETEHLYYRVFLPCLPGLRVYFSSRIEKPPEPIDYLTRTRNLSFVKQTLADLSAICPKPGGAGKAKAAASEPKEE